MDVSLKPEIEARIEDKIRRGEFESANALVERAVIFFLECEEGEMDENEFRETRAAIDEALAQTERGESVPLEEFDRKMRLKHGISR